MHPAGTKPLWRSEHGPSGWLILAQSAPTTKRARAWPQHISGGFHGSCECEGSQTLIAGGPQVGCMPVSLAEILILGAFRSLESLKRGLFYLAPFPPCCCFICTQAVLRLLLFVCFARNCIDAAPLGCPAHSLR